MDKRAVTRHFTMGPTPRTNPEGRLDRSWRIRCRLTLNGRTTTHIVRYERVDGRDACERWAARRNIRFNVDLTHFHDRAAVDAVVLTHELIAAMEKEG